MIDATQAALEKVLGMRMLAHEIHTSNIANANVPNYKARKIDFEARMHEALEGLNPESKETLVKREAGAKDQISGVQADIYEDPLAPMSGDGNTVNMEREQTEIAKNTIAYETAIALINKKFLMQRTVLSEGGR